MIRYIDLFAGVGGFHYGIEMALANILHNQDRREEISQRETHLGSCVYSNEWDKYANSVYRRHYGECDSSDIRAVDAKTLPDFDLLCGGFPCQAFSVAGKRGGFEDTRGTLFFEIARITREKQPRLLLLENVKGLLSHDQGRTFGTIITTLDELGYDCQWQVCNSKNFGVPQNRERVYIVGHLRGTPRPQVFPITGTDKSYNKKLSSTTIDANYWKGIDNHGARTAIAQLNNPTHSNNRIYEVTRQPLRFLNRNQRNIEGDYSFTIDASQTSGVKVDCEIRRLTPIECERLQGFPDNWTQYDADGKLVSDTQRYKMMGNAVTTKVVVAIAERLLA